MKPLLLLVDLQRDFLGAKGLEPPAGLIIERAAELLRLCRQQSVPVAHAWITVTRQPDNRMLHWKERGIWHAVEGTPGHEPPPELTPTESERVIHKTGFSAFEAGELKRMIQSNGADTLIVAGLHLHACIRQTVLEGCQCGLRVWVAEDATGSYDTVHAAITRRYLEARSIRFLTVDELARALADPGHEATSEHESCGSVAQAVEVASSFARPWQAQPTEARAELIESFASCLAKHERGLTELMAREIGKPVRYGQVEVQRTVEMLHDVVRYSQSSGLASVSEAVEVRRRPHGLVAVITPWNNPLYIALGKIVPAVLCGNTVVWKPAPEAREVSRRVIEILREARWLPGLVAAIEGGRREAVELMTNEQVSAVTLTGSSLAGFAAQEICARRRVPLQAELGGNNAAIVWHDADLAEAARCVAAGAFEMTGQRCTANRRAIVLESCREEFLQWLLATTATLKWGDPLDEATQIGPMVSEQQRRRVRTLVARAEAECSSVLMPLGSEPPLNRGCWYPPTILCCETPDAEIVQEETFGPVLVVQTARDWEHAVELCNGVRQGLVASLFTSSHEVAQRFLAQAEAGILKVNQSTADAAVGVPFGGWKASGLGPPEHGQFDWEFFTRPQTVYGRCDSPLS